MTPKYWVTQPNVRQLHLRQRLGDRALTSVTVMSSRRIVASPRCSCVNVPQWGPGWILAALAAQWWLLRVIQRAAELLPKALATSERTCAVSKGKAQTFWNILKLKCDDSQAIGYLFRSVWATVRGWSARKF